ncbi:hypothetical protein [Salipiger sp. HF18]|uniref:hypothetical protein n=1 Tax=Salipiger sp. HF18 TaxID=2721557 RepID=UPI00158B315F|nr:hypothetical protein [Salipiger sp. HF18]
MASKKPSRQQVYTLVVEVGRKAGDGLPDEATGAALMCYASGVDESEAVRETVGILKQADLAPLDVTGYGTEEERRAQGHEIDEEEQALMARALEENSVIVAQITPFFDEG